VKKERPDKIKPNSRFVADGIKESIINPITKEELIDAAKENARIQRQSRQDNTHRRQYQQQQQQDRQQYRKR
jgi:hypothetical protein